MHRYSTISKTFLACLSWLILSSSLLSAQERKYIISDKRLDKQELISSRLLSFNFKNIDGPYYFDSEKRKAIIKAENSKDEDRLLPLLEEYISNFACENFSRDYELLFSLGKVYEMKGMMEEAKDMYRLVLKNTERDRDFVWQIYDKLIFNEKDEYVPLDYYYELVDFRKQVDTLRPPRGVFINMGDRVNSGYEDYGPALNISNNVLLFTSKRNRKKIAGEDRYNEDIFWAAKIDDDGWLQSEAFEGINSPLNEGSPCISRDGQNLFFIRCEAPDGFGNCDLYVTDLVGDGVWGDVRNLGVDVNSPGWDSHPSLSHSEDTLFFVSDRDGGFGSTDIYYTTRLKNGKWSPARNMGPMVNTKNTEASPFYHPKYDVFYFSSNGQLLNFGEFDIFKTRLVNGQWTEPKNIGPLVNGKGEEFYFTIDSESKDLFYARSEKQGFENVDLFSFPLPMEAQPTANTSFGGTLEDSISGEPFQGIVTIIDLTNGIEVAPKYLRSDGSFSFDLINNSRYLLVIQGEEFFRIEKIFELDGDTVLHFRVPAINFVKIEFRSIEFATNDWDILPEMYADLDRLMNFLLDNPTFNLKIAGHTDQQGNAEANNKLSQQRATSIKEYLVNKGFIEPHRIQANGYGSSRPIIKEEKSEEDSKLNRRVEFEIIRQDKLTQENWGRDN